MASLILHGPLDHPGDPLRRPLYLRPVLQPDPNFADGEIFPPDMLLIDVLHRSLRRMFEPDGTAPPAAPTVRVVNLSIGHPGLVFTRRLSAHARLLDWMAHRHNLLIIVSAGNHAGERAFPAVSSASLDDEEALHREALRSLQETARHRRLLAPAEAINVVTVGASHSDGERDAVPLPNPIVDAFPPGVPAPYSAGGFGFKRSVKPDVYFPGGRLLFERPLTPRDDTPSVLQPAPQSAGLAGLTVASPGLSGELNASTLTVGTSNATAQATRAAAQILEILEAADTVDDEFPFPAAEYHSVLAKAFLVHAASWGELKAELSNELGLVGLRQRHELTRILGYGSVSAESLARAARHRAVLVGAATIRDGQRHTYRFPLPSTLRATTEWRRLTLTLAWISAVEPQTQRYRAARLFFTAAKDQLRVLPVEADTQATTRGTVQHQVLYGSQAAVFADGDTLSIDVDCRIDVGPGREATRYGLVASLAVAPSIQVDIHAQIRDALRSRVQTQLRERVRPAVR
jgi:hypothetical protein